jgi:thiol:disulfide interchange protein DsbD
VGLGVFLACAMTAARGGSSAPGRHVKVTLLSPVESMKPGLPLRVGIHLEMEPGWHTYWKNPADSGLPTKVTWRLPAEFAAGPLEWPFPKRIAAPPLMSYGYEGDVLLTATLATPADLSAGSDVTIAGRVDWLECREACLPGKAEVALVLPVRAAEPEASAAGPLFERTRHALPVEAAGWGISAGRGADALSLAFRPPNGVKPREAYFFVDRPLVADYAAPQTLRREDSGFRLEIAPAANAQPPARLSGVLLAETVDGGAPIALAVDVPLAAESAAPAPAPRGAAVPPVVAPSGARAATGASAGTLGVALLFAFVGGLALNLMPCVLPVLSLKVMAFVRQSGEGDGPRRPWRHGLAFTAGVLLSFWTLAGVLLALRAGGRQVGWGFQLQSPAFVAFLAGLFLLLALNLFGVFEVGSSLAAAGNFAASRRGLASSFWNGALATLVATPCTAPFMGSALGYGLAQPALVSLAIFTALALGMAAPYLLLSANPRLTRYVPRPGAWMEAFKQLMGFVLVATVAALLWLYGRQTGVDGMARLVGALVGVSLGAWIYGRGAAPGRSVRAYALYASGAAVLVVASLAAGLAPAEGAPAPAAVTSPSAPGESGLAWEAYSPERLAELRRQGKPVFIDFTASWCLTCQVNERVALGAPEVRERFVREGVTLMKADWTLRDDRITEALAGYGRQGVPVYVLHGRDGEVPGRVLPEVITPGIVLAAIDDTLAARPRAASGSAAE